MTLNNVNNQLNILFWNARGLRGKINELHNFINDNNTDIICINETFLDENHNLPMLNNYSYYRIDKTNHSGGLLFIIKNSIRYIEVPSPVTHYFECAAVQIFSQPSFLLYLVYGPGGTTSDINNHFDSDLSRICSISPLPFFLVGDLNAKHRSWGCVRNNRAGKLLFDFISNSNNFLGYPDEPTYNPMSARITPSTIDLVISNGKIQHSTPITLQEFTSDHFPVSFEIFSSHNECNIRPVTFDYSKANWDGYANQLNRTLSGILSHYRGQASIDNGNIDRLIAAMTEQMLLSEQSFVPKRCSSKTDFTPSERLKQLIRARNFFRRRFNRSHFPIDKIFFDKLKKLVNEEKHRLLNHKFEKILLECNDNNNRIYKVIKNRNHTNIPNFKPVVPGGRHITTGQGKADVLADTFENNHSNPLENSLIQHTRTVNNFVRNLPLSNTVSPPRIHIDEVAYNVGILKVNKASGLDGVSARLIRKLPVAGIHLLTIIFNFCLVNSYFPTEWKRAKTIAIPKPGKTRSLSTSYRPIALLSILSKIFERIVLSRIIVEAHDLNCIPDFQFGFRANHSTTHALKYITDFIEEKLGCSETIGILYFDVQKAFDSVWHQGLIYKLHIFGFPDWIRNLVKSFLTNRSFVVQVGKNCSTERRPSFGVPQGSVLSPTLYSIFVSDIPNIPGCRTALFADDTGLASADRFIKRLTKRLLSGAKKIENFYRKWKISINQSKTQAIFHTKRKTKQLPPSVIDFGGPIYTANSVKYLGVHLDRRLTLTKHVDEAVLKGNNLLRRFYPFLNRNSFATKKIKMKIYKTYVRPAVLYAPPILSKMCKTNQTKLQKLQNKFLRLILGRRKRTRIKDLHKGGDIETVDEFLKRLTTAFLKKCESHDNPLVRLNVRRN